MSLGPAQVSKKNPGKDAGTNSGKNSAGGLGEMLSKGQEWVSGYDWNSLASGVAGASGILGKEVKDTFQEGLDSLRSLVLPKLGDLNKASDPKQAQASTEQLIKEVQDIKSRIEKSIATAPLNKEKQAELTKALDVFTEQAIKEIRETTEKVGQRLPEKQGEFQHACEQVEKKVRECRRCLQGALDENQKILGSDSSTAAEKAEALKKIQGATKQFRAEVEESSEKFHKVTLRDIAGSDWSKIASYVDERYVLQQAYFRRMDLEEARIFESFHSELKLAEEIAREDKAQEERAQEQKAQEAKATEQQKSSEQAAQNLNPSSSSSEEVAPHMRAFQPEILVQRPLMIEEPIMMVFKPEYVRTREAETSREIESLQRVNPERYITRSIDGTLAQHEQLEASQAELFRKKS